MSQASGIEADQAPADSPDDEQRWPVELPLRFKGNTREYFRLWIVNLCLTLFTFGIFSAWAKVRRKRYFYSHTELSSVPFEYLADPLPILKGRLIAAVLLALWYVGTHFSPRLLTAVAVVGVVLWPWVLVRTAAFNARYSAHRNISFHFSGSYRGAAFALVRAVAVVALTCGLGYPWAFTGVRRYFVGHMSLGGVRAKYRVRGQQLVVPLLVVLGLSAAAGGVLAFLAKGEMLEGRALTPALAGIYVIYGVAYAYLGARMAKLNWNHSSLGPIRFRADYRARDFVWLYFTNAVAVLCSLGLLIPWASVRMYRYRVERLSVMQTGSLAAFVGERGASVRATGSEVADLFDFDLSL